MIPGPWPSPSLCGPGERGPSNGLFWGWTESGEHLPPSLDLLISPWPGWRALGQHQLSSCWQATPSCTVFADQAHISRFLQVEASPWLHLAYQL